MALIGSGWYGKNDLFRLVQVEDVEIVALCDPDSRSLTADAKTAAKRHRSGRLPRTFGDYRDLLRQEQPDIVEVATPDHWHALMTIWGCQAGKDVYVEKPASHNIREGRLMIDAARRNGRIVQVGTQARSRPSSRKAIEIARSGTLGDILMAKAWNVQLRDDIGHKPNTPVPNGVDYDTLESNRCRMSFVVCGTPFPARSRIWDARSSEAWSASHR